MAPGLDAVPRPPRSRVGVFGGSFNPIHWGHVRVAQAVRRKLELDPMLLVPAREPPHKREAFDLASAEDRLAMVEQAVKEVSGGLSCCDLEMRRKGPSFTFDTLLEIREIHGRDADLFLLIGADSLPELPTWHRVREIPTVARIVVVNRPGCSFAPTPELLRAIGRDTCEQIESNAVTVEPQPISATEIRDRCRRGEGLEGWVPSSVERYIREKRLYGWNGPRS